MNPDSHEAIKNNQRIDTYKKKAFVSDLESYSYIKTRLCDLWKKLDGDKIIVELKELLPFTSERVKIELRLLIGIARIREPNPMKLCVCKMCKGKFWIPKDQEVCVLGITCSTGCEEEYQELRRDGHWT